MKNMSPQYRNRNGSMNTIQGPSIDNEDIEQFMRVTKKPTAALQRIVVNSNNFKSVTPSRLGPRTIHKVSMVQDGVKPVLAGSGRETLVADLRVYNNTAARDSGLIKVHQIDMKQMNEKLNGLP